MALHFSSLSVLFIDQNMKKIVLISNSRTAWPTKILMPFFSFSDNLLQGAHIKKKKKKKTF